MSPDTQQQLSIELAIAVDALERALDCLKPIEGSVFDIADSEQADELSDDPQMDLFVDDPIPF